MRCPKSIAIKAQFFKAPFSVARAPALIAGAPFIYFALFILACAYIAVQTFGSERD